MFFGRKDVQAKVVGNMLVAVFATSNPSLIWKFDLERNHSFTLALQGEEGDLELGITSPKGEFFPIARFTTREDADLAFAVVQRALLKRRYNWVRCALIGAAGFLVAMMLVSIANYVGRGFHGSAEKTSSSAQIPSGVPLPADQVLRPPQ